MKPAATLAFLRSRLPAVLLALCGAAVVIAGSRYRTGTLTAMGPGFMPVALGICLILLALCLLWSERAHAPGLPTLPLRPVLCVFAGILLWVLLAEGAGFFAAAFALLLACALALPEPNWRRSIIAALVLSIATWVIFIVLLRLPLSAFGS